MIQSAVCQGRVKSGELGKACQRGLSQELACRRRQRQDRCKKSPRNVQQIVHETLFQADDPLILCKIPAFVALAEEAPIGCIEACGVRKRLEDEEPIVGSISTAPKRCQRKCMSCVVREIEPALQGKIGLRGVPKPCLSGRDQAFVFPSCRWLALQRADLRQFF